MSFSQGVWPVLAYCYSKLQSSSGGGGGSGSGSSSPLVIAVI